MYRIAMVGQKFGSSVIILAVLLCASVASAQLEVGDNVSMTLNGNLGYGYSGTFSNVAPSTHGSGIVANANLDGYYFHPNFITFNVRPYFDRAASTSDSQSISRGTGVGASASFFGASFFPGSVSYGLDSTSNSEFYLAGVPSVVGDTTSRHFSVSWSELLPNYPHLYFNFNTDKSSSTLSGTTDESKSASKNLNLNSDYKLAGFDLRANLTHNDNSFTSPDFLTSGTVSFGGSGTTYGVTAQHPIPFGGIGLGYSHSSYSNDQGGGGSGNNFSEGAGVTLFRKLSISENFNYTTNVTAALSQSILNGSAPFLLVDRNADGMYFMSTATLPISRGLSVTGNFSHHRTTFDGQEFSDNQYGGTVNFSRQGRFLGFMTFSVGFVDTANREGNTGAGLVANVGMNKKLGRWDTSADFNYYQTVQTLYAINTGSSYGYGGTLRRKISPQMHWAASFRGMHSGLSYQAGSSNQSESFVSNLSWKRYSVGGSYSQSNGIAVLNSAGGLVTTPVGSQLSDNLYVLNATSWGVNGSARVFPRLNVSGGYTKVSSDTTTGLAGVLANGNRYYARMEYVLRRFSVQGGYSRVGQDVSTIPGGPRVINSFYISLSRWFNVF